MICTECFEKEMEESVTTLPIHYCGKLTRTITILVDRCPKCDHILINQEQANYIDRVRRAFENRIRSGKLD